ncbi:MAG TPA: ABC-2 family transporter protein [Egicoccus sp.]|nr:ABC-2 family transporter protein [Egicoccus sp.]HSK24258.1 ABC-2 family transporter protein [Egicoccus sp.]
MSTSTTAPPATSPRPLRRVGRIRQMADFYATVARTAVQEQFQYRAANYMYMIGMVVEPVIYLVVWSVVAEASGGSVGGYTPGGFAAYYIVWMLVRNMNIVFTPYGWEFRIREGQLSGMLVRPIHPLHYDLAYFAGWKLIAVVLWVPIAIVLALLFPPELTVNVAQAATFFVAIWGAYVIRTLLLFVLGMVTLWTTRVAALFELYFTAELLLSGRLVPLDLMPDWVLSWVDWLPFRSTFGFPIEALVSDLTGAELARGLVAQLVWIAVGWALAMVVWKRAIRRYSAVGN